MSTIFTPTFNGCRHHWCPHCGSNPGKKDQEEKRQNFIRSKVFLLEVKSSCQWSREKVNLTDFKIPDLIKFHNQVKSIEDIQQLILSEDFFGICKVDITLPQEKRSKWLSRNFPPIITRKELAEDEISEEMLHLLHQRKSKFPIGMSKSFQ